MSERSSRPGVIPYLLSSDCEKHIEWLKNVFDGELKEMFHTKDGKVMHCGVAVNGGYVYMSDSAPSAPEQQGGEEPHGFLCHLDVEDPNVIWDKAVSNGATIVTDLKVQYWGGLYGSFKDPFGFEWSVLEEKKSPKPGVIPCLLTPNGDCEKHIDWLKTAFGAEVKEIFTDNDKVTHCSVVVNGAYVYLSDAPSTPQQKQALRQFICHMDVPDIKAFWQKSMDKGANTVVDLKVQSWGELYGLFRDTFGFGWSVSEAEQKQQVKGSVIPYLLSPYCEKQVEWLKNVFDGEVKQMFHTPDGDKVMHCSVALNSGLVYLADTDGISSKQQQHMAGEPQGFLCHLIVPDPNAVWKKAMANGATAVMDLKVQSWGDLYGSFKDPFGFGWAIARAM